MTQRSMIESNHRILVVDDNQAIHDDLRKILIGESEEDPDLLSEESLLFGAPTASVATSKFEIDSAYQGQEGLARVQAKLAQGSPYAMAFVDVRMPPGWDGIETIARLWQVDPNLQIVICTAYSDYSWSDIETKLGHSDNLLILKKPFDHIEAIQLAHALTRKWLVSHQARARLEDLDLMVGCRTAELQAANDELRRARASAEAAAKAKSEFLANMSHEIRTPLNGVLGLSSFLVEETLPESVREVGSLIRTSGEMLKRVLDDVLDFSKIEAGKLELEKEPFCLRESLQWSVGIYRKAALDKQLELKLNVENSVPDRLAGDATRLRQVLTNLISNAIKFTESGSVEVSVRSEDNGHDLNFCRLHIAVTDTGIGIPENRIDRLFQSFSQVDASTSRRFGGTGLGLAICKRLVEMMGGEISVKSSLGAGTTFAFVIPANIAAPEVQLGNTKNGWSPSRRVLVVEDNAINRVVIQRMLEKLGHSVDLVSNGETAIRHVQEREYDLLLMDVHIPGLDGFETTRRIRQLPKRHTNIPIVALTASAMANDREDCLNAGMNDYVSKPISLEALRAVIDRWTSDALPAGRNLPPPTSLGESEPAKLMCV